MTDFLRPVGFVVSVLAAVLLLAVVATAVVGKGLAFDLWSSPTFWAYLGLALVGIGAVLFVIRFQFESES